MSKSSLDHTLGALCKDDDTRRLAKAYFTLVRSLRPGEDTVNLPKGVECVCVWFATERMKKKSGKCLKGATDYSRIGPTRFIDSVSTIQLLLQKAKDSATRFGRAEVKKSNSLFNYDCTPLPVYDPPCPECTKRDIPCIKINSSFNCVCCFLKKMPCEREDSAIERSVECEKIVVQEDVDIKPTLTSLKRSNTIVNKQTTASLHPSRQLGMRSQPNSVASISTAAAKSVKDLPKLFTGSSKTASASSTHVQKTTGSSLFNSCPTTIPLPSTAIKHREPTDPPLSAQRSPQKHQVTPSTQIKRSLSSQGRPGLAPKEAATKPSIPDVQVLGKRPAPGTVESPVTIKRSRPASPELSGLCRPFFPKLGRKDSQLAVKSSTQNGSAKNKPAPADKPASTRERSASYPMAPPKSGRSRPRLPSPSPSDREESTPQPSRGTQPPTALPTPVATPSRRSSDPPREFHTVLRRSIRHTASEIISYVKEHGCEDTELHLKVLDMQTRVDELDRLALVEGRRGSENEDGSPLTALEEMILEAEKDIVAYVKKNGCPNIRLKMKILDLNTRLQLQ